MRITIAIGERCHLSITSETGSACQWPNEATESSKFSPTSLSKMKTDDVKNSYCLQPTRVDCGREDYTNYIQIDWSWYNLILYYLSL
jgi:hypothetical protein